MNANPNRLAVSKRKNRGNHQAGFGLIEVLVAFGLVGILTAVMTSLFGDIIKQQKQANVTSTLTSMRENIMKLLADGRAWNNTIADAANANATCLQTRDGTCNHIVPGAPPVPLVNAYFDAAPFLELNVLRDSSAAPGQIYIDSTIATSGFTDQGSPCPVGNNFDLVAGNDICPIRWEIRMQYTCPAPGTCIDPAVRVIAFVYYRPDPTNPLKALINENRYMIDMTRGARGENRSEILEYSHQLAGANVGGGNCTPLAWNNINLNAEILDAGNNGVIAGGAVTLNPGTYTCSATTSCFTCGALRLQLVNQTAGVVLASSPGALAPQWTLAQTTIPNTTFIANGPTTVRIQHFCNNDPPAGFEVYGMGMTLPDYGTPTKFSTLTCTRIF